MIRFMTEVCQPEERVLFNKYRELARVLERPVVKVMDEYGLKKAKRAHLKRRSVIVDIKAD